MRAWINLVVVAFAVFYILTDASRAGATARELFDTVIQVFDIADEFLTAFFAESSGGSQLQ